MDNVLANLSTCCHGLRSKKVTERKKQVEVFRALINQNKCISAVDKCSKENKGLTWKNILIAVTDYVNRETEYLLKNSKSHTTIKSSGRKAQSGSNLFKFFIRKANARGPQLNGKQVLNHIIEILQNSSTCALFGVDYCSVLWKDILSVPQMRCQIPQSLWQELLVLICEKYSGTCDGLDRVFLLQIIESIIFYGSKQTQLNAGEMFKFCKIGFDTLRKEQSQSHIESFISTVLAFFHAFAAEHRLQMCKLGESVLPTIFDWWESRFSDGLKLSLVRFIEFQLTIHHPCGVSTFEKGSYADDQEVWKKYLRKIYKYFLFDIEHKNKYITGKVTQLPLSYLNVIAQVCRQVSYFTFEELHSQEETSIASKRRKNDGPISNILDEINKNANMEASIIWLQILAHYLSMFSDSLSKILLDNLLTELHQLLINCKKGLISEYLMEICCACVDCQEYLELNDKLSNEELLTLKKSWKLIYDRSLRLFTLNQAKDQCLKLIKLLILKKLVKVDVELWNLFTSKQILSEPLLQVLALYLQHNEMPKQNPREILPSQTDEQFFKDDSNLAFRSYLFQFLLRPLFDEDNVLQSHFNQLDFKLLSQILVTLCLWSPLDFKLIKVSKPNWMNSNDRKNLEFLEMFYLKSTFNSPFDENENVNIQIQTDNVSPCLVMLEKLFGLILRDVRILTDHIKPELQIILIACDYCCLLMSIIQLIFSLKVVTVIEFSALELYGRIEMLFRLLTESIETFSNQENKQQALIMQPIMEKLLILCTDCLRSNDIIFIRKLIPDQLIQFLFSFFQTGVCNGTTKDNVGSTTPVDDSFDEPMQMEFDDESNFSEDSLTRSLLFNEYNASVTDSVYNSCVKCLCAFNCFDVDKSMVPTNSVKTKVIELFINEDFDVNIPFNLLLALNTLRDVFQSEQLFNTDAVGISISLFRKISKIYYKQMDVVINIFNIIALLVPYLQHSSTDAKHDILNLLYSFWKRHKGSSMGAQAMLSLIKCINAIVKIDPVNEWARWPLEDSNDSSDTNPISIYLIEMMKPQNNYEVRLEAAVSIANSLKIKPQICEMSSGIVEWQNVVLNKVLATKKSWELTSESIQRIAQVEASINNQCVFIMALTNIAAVNSYCEKRAVFLILAAILEDKILVDVAKKALGRMAISLGFPNVECYLQSHFDYLIFNWFVTKHDIFKFPFQVINFYSLEIFTQEFYPFLFPWSLITGNQSIAVEIARLLDRSMKDLIEECFPKIAAYIIPFMAVKGDESLSEGLNCSITFNQAYDFLKSEITSEGFNNLLWKFLNEIIVEMLSSLRVEEKPNFMSPPSNPPNYSKAIIESTCRYIMIQKNSTAVQKSIVTLLAKEYSIQTILLSLRLNVVTVHRIHDRLRMFLAYKVFVQWVFEQLSNLEKMKLFLIRDVTHTLIYFIVEYSKEKELASQAIRFLSELSECILQVSLQEFGNVLPFIVNSLLPLLLVVDLKDQVMSLFDVLLVKNVDKMSDFIQALDPFPDIPELSAISDIHRKLKYANGNLTLEDEINCFMENCRIDTDGTASNRLEGLRFLKEQISNHKSELFDITQTLSEMPRFSEVCQTSVIHQLITELIHISSSPDEEVAIEAARCLGEIGAIDLYSLVLRVDEGAKIHKKEFECFRSDAFGQRNAIILKLLCENLFNKNTELVKATSMVIKTFLSTNSGKSFISQYENKREDDLILILNLFKSENKGLNSSMLVELDEESIMDTLKNNISWCPTKAGNYDTWITNLVCDLIDSATMDKILHSVIPIAKLQVKFCQTIFPFVIYAILRENGEKIQLLLSQEINEFFKIQCEYIKNNDSFNIPSDKEAIKTMLSMINYLRLQEKSIKSKTSQWDQNFWLNLNYFNVAKAAEYCNANFSALMFLQIWANSLIEKNSMDRNSKVEYIRTYNFAHILSEIPSSSEVYELILKTFRNIGDADGCLGFQIGEIELPMKRIYEYECEINWNKALEAYSHEADTNPSYQMGVLKALKMLGHTHVLETYLKGISSSNVVNNQEYREFQYECMWRTCQWTLPRDSSTEIQFNKSVYNVVTDLLQEEESRFTKDMLNAYTCVIKNLSSINLENTNTVYSSLAQLQILNQIEDYKNAKNGFDEPLEMINKKWLSNNQFTASNFLFMEPVVTSQIVLLQLNNSSATNNQILCERLLWKSKLAREAKYLELAATTVAQAKSLKNLNKKLIWNCEMEEARIFWEREESKLAIQKIRKLLSDFDKDGSNCGCSGLHYEALGLISKWLIETKSEIPKTIMQHLSDAITLNTQIEENSDMTDAYLAIARYSDSNYQQITTHMESTEFESNVNLINKSKDDAGQLRQQISTLNMDQKRSVVFLEKQSRMDEQEIQDMKENQKVYLKQALKCYLLCLKTSGTEDLRIFRFISLWFQNQSNEEVNKLIHSTINHISSHKFLSLMHQLAARISTKNNSFQTTLYELIEKICTDHSSHCLYIILALCNAYKGEDPSTEPRQLQFEKDRVLAAEEIIKRLERKQHLSATIDKQKKLCDAYIAFSNYSGSDNRQGVPIAIPLKTPLLKLSNLFGVPIPTDDIPINPSGNYNVPYITSYEPHYKLCGGINMPKVLTCTGSDGKKRIQLLKGQDDLRQDAVMQQVFGVVNMLLKQNSETKKTNLHIRTYKVVPLSQRSGIVQWCKGTQPFGDNVISAHTRYHPNEYSVAECRNMICKAAQMKLEKKLEVFEKVCSNFHPALHYFFFENFLEPVAWFERIQAYTKSVATNSIVGYILGLGDRHVANILIDKLTAEVIHIDLGVAFDQGKLLPIPETIPFRLTRDVIDGMGITGIEGVFRKSCERTLEVLRQSQEIVLTLLEVLLYDPLYSWTLTPEKIANLQEKKTARNRPSKKNVATGDANNEEETINKHAERVLRRLQQKLQGIEGGTTLSVIGQVNYLIKEAIDPKNLCALFAGWQPYL